MSVREELVKTVPEFVGGGIAYWMHHFFHRIWSGEALIQLVKFLRKLWS